MYSILCNLILLWWRNIWWCFYLSHSFFVNCKIQVKRINKTLCLWVYHFISFIHWTLVTIHGNLKKNCLQLCAFWNSGSSYILILYIISYTVCQNDCGVYCILNHDWVFHQSSVVFAGLMLASWSLKGKLFMSSGSRKRWMFCLWKVQNDE